MPAVIAAGSSHATKFGELPEQQELSPALHAAPGKGIPPMLLLHIFGKSDGAFHPPDNNYCTSHQARILAGALGEAGVRCDVVGVANKDHVCLDSEIGKPDDFVTQAVENFIESL